MYKSRLLSMGTAEPDNVVKTKDLAIKLGKDPDWAERVTGIKSRRYVDEKEASSENDLTINLAKSALDQALQRANLTIKDIDVIVCASAVPVQAIPASGPLLQAAYGKEAAGIPAFDINATCVSFVTAFDLMSNMISIGKYKRVAIVSTDLPSLSLNPEDPKSTLLFGDGSAAAILERVPENSDSEVLSSHMETYGSGAHNTEIKAGGTAIPPKIYDQVPKTDFMFSMDGEAIFKLSMKKAPKFLERLFENTNLTLDDIDMVIPHQASGLAMKIMQRRLNIPKEKFYSILSNHGNMVSASIPTALGLAIDRGDVKRGDKILLIGTAAGLTMQGVVFTY